MNSNPKRFTLRKEYFGGIIHDAKTLNIELLTMNEYEYLVSQIENNKKKREFSLPMPRINEFIKKGFLQKNTIRVVSPPKVIRSGVLTAPIRIFDSYTRRCNFQCDQCYFSSSAFIEETRRTISQTKKIIRKFYDAGTTEWRFTGGEALMMPDIFEAIAETKKLGMNTGIYSNGWWTDETANKVFASGIDEIALSLEGTREVNDKRRKKGGFDKVIETLTRIRTFNKKNTDRAIKTIIATAVGKDNVQDIPFLAHLASQYGCDINFIPLKPSGRARYTLGDDMLNPEEYKKFAQTVQEIREDKQIKQAGTKISLKYKDLFCPSYEDKSDKPFPFNYAECGALTTYLSMMPNGQVFSCPFILDVDTEGKYIGPNMNTTSVEKAWNHPHFEHYRDASKIGCTDCDFYMKQCRGKCRATVLGFDGEIKNGKLLGDDPQCFASLL